MRAVHLHSLHAPPAPHSGDGGAQQLHLDQRAADFSLHSAQPVQGHHSHGGAGRDSAGLSRLAADSEVIAMRASGLGIGYFVRVASIVAVGGTLLGLVNSLYVAPRANQAILEMEQALAASQASYEIQPRVFYEDFHNACCTCRTCAPEPARPTGARSSWPMSPIRPSPKITTAASATVVNDSTPGIADAPARRSASTRRWPASRSSTTSPPSPPPICRSRSARRATCTWAAWTPPSTPCRPMCCFKRTHGPDGQALPHRVAQPLRLSRRLPGADAGGRAAGRDFAPRRQELPASSSPFCWSFSTTFSPTPASLWPPGQAARLSWRSGWPTCSSPRPASFCSGRWPAAAAFSAPSSAWASRCQVRTSASAGTSRNGVHLTGLLDRLAAAPAARPRPAASFPASSTSTSCASSSACSSWCCAGFVLLMLVFTFFELVGRHPAQPHRARHGRRVPGQPDAQHALPDRSAGGADRRAGHLRRAQPQQRNHRHEGHRHQPLPAGGSHRLHRRHPRRQPLSLRRVLSAPGQPPAGGSAQHHQGPPAADRSASRAELDLRPAAPRRARPHLLLPVLRSRPQRVRQSLRLRVRSLHLRALAAHLRRSASSGMPIPMPWRFQNGWERDI